MASPVYVNTGGSIGSAGAATLSPTLPASRSNGNLLIAICQSKNNAAHSWPGDWSVLEQVNSGTGLTVSLAYRIVDGTESSPTITWTGAVACRALIYQWSGTAGESPFSGGHNSNNGLTSTHSCAGVNTTRSDSRVVYFDGCATGTALGTPSGWTENSDLTTGVGFQTTVGGKDIASSGSASGDISVTGGNAAWVMWQIELRSPSSGAVVSPMFYHVLLGACG